MKKLFSILLAIMMIGAVACAAYADEVPQPEAGKKFESNWAIPGGLAQIVYEEEGYRVDIDITKEDGTGANWQYNCFYQEEGDCLASIAASRTNYTIDPNTGDKVYGEAVYEDFAEEKYSEFTIDADGFLIWKDAHDDAGAGLKFVNIGGFGVEGLWKNKEAEVEVLFQWCGATEDEMKYTVNILRGNTEGDHYSDFLMDGTYDPATGKLSAYGTCTECKKNANGEFERTEDGENYEAFFSMTEDGKVLFETENGIELEYDMLGNQG